MTTDAGRVALITNREGTAELIKTALTGLFVVDTFKNGIALHHALENHTEYKAIISEDELQGVNGIPLQKALNTFGYSRIPFMVLMDTIDNEKRETAMSAAVAEIFSRPVDKRAFRLRVPYLVENYHCRVGAANSVGVYRLPLSKRLFDIFFSGLALLLLSPLFLLIAIVIRAESKGPVFYYSLRVGSGYHIFKFFKFRSMFTGADSRLKDLSHLNQYTSNKGLPAMKDEPVKELCNFCRKAGIGCMYPLYADNKIVCETLYQQQKESSQDPAFTKIKNDPRVTRVGNFIRNTSLDELPQLWNVFIGDMSIVGNRPLPLYEAEKITTDKYAQRFMAPAGITGLWQVEKRGRGKMSEEERLNLDNNYATTHSFGNDVRLILRTVPALFQSENV